MTQIIPPDPLRPVFESAQRAIALLDRIGAADVAGEFNHYLQCLGQMSAAANDSDFPGLQDVCDWLREAFAHDDAGDQVSDRTIALHHQTLELVMDYIASACDVQCAGRLSDHLRLPRWQAPLEEDDAEILLEMLASADPGSATAVVDTAAVSGEVEVGGDVLVVLCDEVQRIADALSRQLKGGDPQMPAADCWRGVLEAWVAELDRFSQVLATAELEGLSEAVFYLVDNLNRLAAGDEPPDENRWALIDAWRNAMLAYLQHLNDADACRVMTDHLRDSRWPAPLPECDVDGMVELLALPRRVQKAQPASSRPARVDKADVSLALPTDANSGLLDALLEELPQQSAAFSALMQTLMGGTGRLDDVKSAMRIAHSLKGAANTVGVAGIANLPHYLEDILQALFEHNRLPGGELAGVLMQAADCLEAMTEALQGLSGPPDNAVETLQLVLDWANRIDADGLDGVSEAAAAAVRPAPGTAESEVSPAAATGGGMRLAPQLMDTLLRLLGESTIVNGQIQNRVHCLAEHNKAVRLQNERVQTLLNQMDQLVSVQGEPAAAVALDGDSEFDALELEEYSELQSCISRLEEAAADCREMCDALTDHINALDGLAAEQERLQKENQSVIYRSRMVAVNTIVPRLERAVRQACRLTGKTVDLSVEGGDTLIDSQALADLIEPLMHVLRNAVDHGIEPAAQRREGGKNERGGIVVRFARRGDLIEVSCEDDGAGLDTDRIRAVAEKKGLTEPDEVLSEDEINALILAPRFTTKDAATQVSGRGIGMDAVYAKVRAMKGTLSLHSRHGQGLKVVIHTPVSLLSVPAVLVRCGGQHFAISSYGVEQILHGSAGEYAYGDAGAELIYHDQRMALIYLGTLLGMRTRQHPLRPMIVVEQDVGPKKAVLVDEVIYSREIVVKNMGAFVPQLRGIAGVTILGDGGIAPVLDLPELLRAGVCEPGSAEEVDALLEDALPRALVVDDSLSARRALAEFVEDCGFDVQTAIDGMDALGMIQKQPPDILFVDLEMPRMNGMELARYVRVNSELAGMPIVMVSSRASEKHRRQANAAGVDVFIAKPFSEDQLHECLETLCPGSAAQ